MLMILDRKQFNVPMKTVVEWCIAKKKMNRHLRTLRDNHSEPPVQTSDSSELETDKGIESIIGNEITAEIPH